MQRVLSLQMTRNIGESSEYVTKRLCVSFLFSVGFLCLLCGFLLGRFAAERSMETQMQKRGELAGNGLRKTEHLQQVALLELARASFDYEFATDWQSPNLMKDNTREENIRIDEFFSNLSLVHEVINHKSCVRATIRGSREPDRYVILSVNVDGIAVALELAQVLDRIYSAHDWRPQRSLMFCVSWIFQHDCPQTLPTFIRQKIVAFVALDRRVTEANDHVALSGSDVIRSIAVEAIKTIPDGNWTYLENEVFGPRLFLNIPYVLFSLNDSNSRNNQTHHNQNLRSHNIILAQMISQTMWRLSESIVIQWEPKYFNKTVNEVLELIDNREFQYAKETLKRTLRVLLAAVKELNTKIDATEITQTLQIRIWNDLLLDLDKALLCFDSPHPVITGLVNFHKMFKSTNKTLNYLEELAKCYENAIQILKEK